VVNKPTQCVPCSWLLALYQKMVITYEVIVSWNYDKAINVALLIDRAGKLIGEILLGSVCYCTLYSYRVAYEYANHRKVTKSFKICWLFNTNRINRSSQDLWCWRTETTHQQRVGSSEWITLLFNVLLANGVSAYAFAFVRRRTFWACAVKIMRITTCLTILWRQ